MPHLSDLEIIELLLTQNLVDREKAFRAIYNQYYQLLKPNALGMGLSGESYKDIFQDGLIDLYRKAVRGSLEPEKGTLRSLLSKIIRNKILNLFRKKSEQRLSENYDVEIEEEDELILEEERNMLLDKIAKLDEKCRKILKMFYFDRFSMEAIASILGFKSIDAVKVAKYRCLKKLQKIYFA